MPCECSEEDAAFSGLSLPAEAEELDSPEPSGSIGATIGGTASTSPSTSLTLPVLPLPLRLKRERTLDAIVISKRGGGDFTQRRARYFLLVLSEVC